MFSKRCVAWLALLLSVGLSGSARAGELTITAQAVAAHGEFLTQAPPPPVQGVLCVVDAGVDLTPDTEPILVGRESVFGGAVDDVSQSSHGTYVAMVAGAPANGWGMVGGWPRLKVLSVRALDGTGEDVGVNLYRQAIQRCVRAKLEQGVNVRVIELAVGGRADIRSPNEVVGIRDSISRARQNDIVVISAAGNDGGTVNVPAALDEVFAVTGSDLAGRLCGFSSRGSEVDLASLGCGMDVTTSAEGGPATGASTSLASAYVAGVAVALRSYRPDLSVERTEALLRDAAEEVPAGRALDAAATFRAAGLADLVNAYRPPAPLPVAVPRCNLKRETCATPRLKSVHRRGRRLVIRLTRVPRGARAVVWADRRRLIRTRSTIIRVNVRRWTTLTIRFTAPGRQPSAALRIAHSEVR